MPELISASVTLCDLTDGSGRTLTQILRTLINQRGLCQLELHRPLRFSLNDHRTGQ